MLLRATFGVGLHFGVHRGPSASKARVPVRHLRYEANEANEANEVKHSTIPEN